MSVLEDVRKFIAKAGRHLALVELPEEQGARLREELGLAPTDPLAVDGVPVVLLSERDLLLERGSQYAAVRWRRIVTREELRPLFHAIDTKELPSLIAIVIDQSMDDEGVDDPADAMDAAQHKDMENSLREIGFGDAEV